MKKKILLLSLLIILVGRTSLAQKQKVTISRDVVLLVQEKDPRIAYSASILPFFGPLTAAEYVSTSPVTWEVDRELNKRAKRQAYLNLATIGAGILIDSAKLAAPDNQGGGEYVTIGFLLTLFHNSLFGKDMAQEAIRYNKNLHQEFQWDYPVFQQRF